jgi:hypothetical protein
VLHRFGDRRLGDGVEHHALDRLCLERPLLLEDLQHVPRDRLALAIRVGRKDQLVGGFDRAGDLRQPLLRLGVDLPDHAEVRLGVDRAGLGRQVPDMAEGGQHLVATAKIFIDCLGLSRGFDDDDVHSIRRSRRSMAALGARGGAAAVGRNMGNRTLAVKYAGRRRHRAVPIPKPRRSLP